MSNPELKPHIPVTEDPTIMKYDRTYSHRPNFLQKLFPANPNNQAITTTSKLNTTKETTKTPKLDTSSNKPAPQLNNPLNNDLVRKILAKRVSLLLLFFVIRPSFIHPIIWLGMYALFYSRLSNALDTTKPNINERKLK